jgi:murein DD-endopeptidase MepM/ murein hydrolase activator NlpD
MRFRRFLLISGASLLAALGWTAPATAVDGWRWPLAGSPGIVRGFDPPPLPWLAGHRGVDLRARPGETVQAAGPGVIGFAGMVAGLGVVTVHHANGLMTTYEPVDASVHAGHRVDAGDLIGHVTAGHGDCGAGRVCLHWGLRRGVTYLDPLQLVRAPRVRLLPIYDQTAVSHPVARAPRTEEAAAVDHQPARQRDGPPVLPLAALGGLAAGVIAIRRAGAG